MDRRRFLAAVLGLLVAVPLAAKAQQVGKVWRIGWMANTPLTDPASARLWEGFRQALQEHGYVEGKNVVFEPRFAEGKYERFPTIADELVRLKVDLIVAANRPATEAARSATSTIPIVMVLVGNVVGSLARPQGNVTGLTTLDADIHGKQLQILKEAIPRATRVSVLWTAIIPGEHLKVAARSLRVQLQLLAARSPEEFDDAFSAMTRERSEALLVIPDGRFLMHRKRLADLAMKARLPTMFGASEYAEAGGLMAYGTSNLYLVRRVAAYVDKILKGTKPADLPVEQPTKFELVINLKTAKILGLTIPPSLLGRADEVIQ